MLKISDGSRIRLEFPLLADCPRLKHGVYQRQGGCSNEPYHSLNLSTMCGDELANVHTNRTYLGCDKVISCLQCHGDTITPVNRGSSNEIPNSDALVTDTSGLGLLICHADCQAVILYDPILHVVANIHSGWRGNVQNILGKSVTALTKKYGSKPENLLVGISPSIGPCHAEFKNFEDEFPENFWVYQKTPNHFDFWNISRVQLETSGVLPHHIEIAGICTVCNKTDFFSYRRDRVTGRNGTFVQLL